MNSIFDDGRYVITEATLSTPTKLYPIAHATARIRMDLWWLASASGALSAAAWIRYRDLLTVEEQAVLALIPISLLILAMNMGILAIDSVGHQRSLIIARPKKVRALFEALRRVKLAEFRAPPGSYTDQSQLNLNFGKQKDIAK